jgi:hypothetical protein
MLKPSAAQGEKAGLPKSARLDARHFDLLLQAATRSPPTLAGSRKG